MTDKAGPASGTTAGTSARGMPKPACSQAAVIHYPFSVMNPPSIG
jgi:hypothetical protein